MTIKATKKRATPRVADQILEGLREALAFERGELADVRVDRVAITARQVTAEKPPAFEASRIIGLRKATMGVSQSVFASILNVSPETVRAWEQGKNPPSGPALRLLEIAEKQPHVVLAGRLHVHGRPFSSLPGTKGKEFAAKRSPMFATAHLRGVARQTRASVKAIKATRKK